MAVIDQPFLSLWIAWISAAQLPLESLDIINTLRRFYANFHSVIMRSLLTLAHILEALTTLYVASAFGSQEIFLKICECSFKFSFKNAVYLVGSPTVSA